MVKYFFKKCLVIGIIILFLGASIIPSISGFSLKNNKPVENVNYRGNWLYVGGSGPNNYSTIQEAINDANEEDTIYVYDDSAPYEENIVIDKSLNLLGENKITTIIDGNDDYVCHITSNEVNLDNFSLINGMTWIDYVYYINISNCTFSDHLSSSGIYIDSSAYITFRKCKISQNYGYGIEFKNSNYNNILNCEISNNYLCGLRFQLSSYNKVADNCHIHDCGGSGITLYSLCRYNTIKRCNISYNNKGIWISHQSSSNRINHCTFTNNNGYGIEIYFQSPGLEIYHNNFINNNGGIHQGYDSHNKDNDWDKGYPIGGNYWSDFDEESEGAYDDYSGPGQDEPGSDGIVDNPYWIVGGNTYDDYPLMNYSYGINPPYEPYDPDPYDGQTDVNINQDLSWSGGDPDGDDVFYEVYFGTSIPPPYKSTVHLTIYEPGEMDYLTVYYWQIIAIDENGLTNESPIWSFTTMVEPTNYPPEFSNEKPFDGATDIPISLSEINVFISDPEYDLFSWTIETSPDIGSCIGTNEHDGKKICSVSGLEYSMTYIWKVFAWDVETGIISQETFTFTTIEEHHNQPPNKPDIDGPPNGKPGIEYTFCIIATDPDGNDLHVLWDWGDGTSSGWSDPFASGTEVCESHKWSKSGKYIIEVTVKDEYGATVTASLEFIIPRDRATYSSFLFRFFDMFPILQSILDFIK